MPNTCKIFHCVQLPDFPSISRRQANCSAFLIRILRQRVSKPHCAASDPLEQIMIRTDLSAPLALRRREAAKALGISPRLLWQLTKDGQIPCVRVGSGTRKSVLYPV